MVNVSVNYYESFILIFALSFSKKFKTLFSEYAQIGTRHFVIKADYVMVCPFFC